MSVSLPAPSFFNKGKLEKVHRCVEIIKEVESVTGEEWRKK